MADIEVRQESPTAFHIKIHETDNVAITVNNSGLKVGTRFPDGLELTEYIPQGHKVALLDIPVHDEIVRYGEMIDYAVRHIPRDSRIDESMVELPKVPPLETLLLAAKVPKQLSPFGGYAFEGYRNASGSVDTKSLFDTSTDVHCVAGVVDYVVEIIERDLLPKHPNADGVVGLNRLYGYGAATNAPAVIVSIHTIHNIALDPNSDGKVMVIGLGCEKLQPERLLEGTYDVKSIPADSASTVSLQDGKYVGFQSTVTNVLQVAERHLEKSNRHQRETCPASELVVGMRCGDNDAFSGVTANLAVDYASDLLACCGTTVMFSEAIEARGAIHLLTPRTISEEVGERLLEGMAQYGSYLNMGKTDRSVNPSPGNKKGGLADVAGKALSSIAKSGKNAIAEVLPPGQRSTERGLICAATPAGDFVCDTQQVALRITVQVLTTGHGVPYGLMAVPVVKMTTRTELANRQFDLMDINTGTIAAGRETTEDVGLKLFEFIFDVTSGRKKTFSDQQGLHNQLAAFNPAPVA